MFINMVNQLLQVLVKYLLGYNFKKVLHSISIFFSVFETKNYDFDDNETSTSRTNYSFSRSNTIRLNRSSYYTTDGLSMPDLDNIIALHDTTEDMNTNTHSYNISDNSVKSPGRKENLLLPPPPTSMVSITNGNLVPFNKSRNGGLLIAKNNHREVNVFNISFKILGIPLCFQSFLIENYDFHHSIE